MRESEDEAEALQRRADHYGPAGRRGVVPAADLCRKHGMSSASVHGWKAKYGGVGVSDAQEFKGFEVENPKLKRLLADAMLDNAALKDLLGKNGDARARKSG